MLRVEQTPVASVDPKPGEVVNVPFLSGTTKEPR